MWRTTLWSSMSAITRISFAQRGQVSGSDSYTCLMSLAQEALAAWLAVRSSTMASESGGETQDSSVAASRLARSPRARLE